jgi:hypothetical protein
LSGRGGAHKIAAMSRTAAAMLNTVVDRLVRWLPHSEPDGAPHPWRAEDSSWHTSSYELLQGLEVVELQGIPPTFADTLPAFHAAAAKRA